MKFSAHLPLGVAALALALLAPSQTAFAQAGDAAEGDSAPSVAENTAASGQIAASDKPAINNRSLRIETNQPIIVPQDYEIAPAMWLLSDEDTSIYMFGTYHILPPGFRWRSDLFNQIVNEADELVIETSSVDSAKSDKEMAPFFAGETAPRPLVSDRLSPENKAKWLKLGSLLGYRDGAFDRNPLLLSVLSFSSYTSKEDGALREYGVETILEARFARDGKPIGSIEDATEVTMSLINIEDTSLVAQIDRDLARWDGVSLESMFAPPPFIGKNGNPNKSTSNSAQASEDANGGDFREEHSWARGEPQPIGVTDFGADEFGRAVYTALLTERNRKWAIWLEDRLKEPGTVLLAVGAGHLAGVDSVQDMLDERGLKAERVQ